MKQSNKIVGALVMLGAIVVFICLANYLQDALLTGQTHGRRGAIHMVGSVKYTVGVGAIILGMGLATFLGWMAWGWIRSDDQ